MPLPNERFQENQQPIAPVRVFVAVAHEHFDAVVPKELEIAVYEADGEPQRCEGPPDRTDHITRVGRPERNADDEGKTANRQRERHVSGEPVKVQEGG